MKKLLSIILILAMSFTLIACSSDEEEIRGEQISNTESEVAEDKFSLGATDNLTYKNTFIGIGCSLPEGWSFYTDEQIHELNNYTAEVAGDDYVEAMKSADLVYDMFAIGDDQLNNINVNLEKINKSDLEQLDLEMNFENTIPQLQEAFGEMGYQNLKFEISTVLVGEEEVMCLQSYGVIDGLEMFQKIISIKCDGYLANITVTTYQEDLVDSLYEEFYFIKNI